MISAKLAVTVLESGIQLVERFSLFNVTAQECFENIFKSDIHVDRVKFHDRIILLYPELNSADFDAFFDYLDVVRILFHKKKEYQSVLVDQFCSFFSF